MALRLCESSRDARGFAEEQGEAYAHGAGRADLTRICTCTGPPVRLRTCTCTCTCTSRMGQAART